jgi:hypothetical protein
MIALALFIFIFIGKNIFCQELTGFRNAPWGSSVNEVKNMETESYMQSFQGFGIYAISYKGKVAGLTAWIDYTFINDKLIEGSYLFEPPGNFGDDFNKLRIFLVSGYGNPDFRAGPDSIWIKVTDYGRFKGPELYWQFNNGFIALIASKFNDEITIIILYSNRSIEEYNKEREVPSGSFFNFSVP